MKKSIIALWFVTLFLTTHAQSSEDIRVNVPVKVGDPLLGRG